MEKMTESQVEAELLRLPDWSSYGESIQRTYAFKDFVHAMKFVYQVADLAEQNQHHPDILVRYKKVTLTLATHDAGGVTSKDFDLATKIDALVRKPERKVRNPEKPA